MSYVDLGNPHLSPSLSLSLDQPSATDTAQNTWETVNSFPSHQIDDLHDYSIVAAVEGMADLENRLARNASEPISADVAKSTLPSLAASALDRLLETRGVEVDLGQREDMVNYATGQALHLFEERWPDSW